MKVPNNKPRLVVNSNHCFANSIEDINTYFDIKIDNQYDPVAGDLYLISDYDKNLSEKIQYAKNKKLKVIVDCLWEQQSLVFEDSDILVLKHKLWFWVHEYYYNIKNKINKIEFNHNQKIFKGFMPIRLRRDFRTTITKKLPLENFIWSYDDKKLPGDNTKDVNDRLLLADWYNKTLFSVVVETSIAGEVFITEKTFKPIFCGHPFMIIAQPGALNFLKSNDFVTYNNLFDESYDDEPDLIKKLNIITDNINLCNLTKWDEETNIRIQTNQKVFYDKSKVISKLLEIVTDIYEHAET